MERWQSGYERRISELESVNAEQDRLISLLLELIPMNHNNLSSPSVENMKYHTQEGSNGLNVKESIKSIEKTSVTSNAAEKGIQRIRKLLLQDISNGIAFHARLSRDITSLNKGQIIVFDHVVIDTVNAYSVHDGEFTVPVTGIYVFYWNLMTNSASQMDTCLFSTAGTLGYGYVDNGHSGFSNGGNMVIAHLNQGIRVWVAKADNYGQFLHERFSTFSGFLLQ